MSEHPLAAQRDAAAEATTSSTRTSPDAAASAMLMTSATDDKQQRPLFPSSPPAVVEDDDTTRSSNSSLSNRPSLLSRSRPSSSSRSTRVGLGNEEPSEEAVSAPLPRFLSLAAAPHLVPPDALSALPHDHLVTLVATLSDAHERTMTQLEQSRKQCTALEQVCIHSGISQGEVDRAKLRAKVDFEEEQRQRTLKAGDWRIQLIQKPVESDQLEVPAASGVMLNLDDLADAISDNPFASPTQPTFADFRTSDDRSSVSKLSIHSQPEIAVASGSSVAVPRRGRHASLSSRLFGSLSGHSGSHALSTSPTVSTSPKRASKLEAHSKNESVRANASDAAIAAPKSGEEATKGYGDWLGWKSWSRGDAKLKSSSPSRSHARASPVKPEVATLFEDESGSAAEQASGLSQEVTETDDASSIASAQVVGSPPAPSIFSAKSQVATGHTSLDPEPERSPAAKGPSSSSSSPTRSRKGYTPANAQAPPSAALSMPVTSATLSAYQADSPSSSARRTSHSSLASIAAASDHDDALDDVSESAHVESRATTQARRASTGARRTSHLVVSSLTSNDHQEDSIAALKAESTCSLGLGFVESASMARSASEGRLASATTGDSSSAAMNKLASFTRYTPFASPALSTPSPQVSLSSHATVIVAPQPASGPTMTNAPTTMELSAILDDSAPPTLAVSTIASGSASDEGPMVDRYGFIHDVKSGMRLLREARRRKERRARGEPSGDGEDEADDKALQAAAALIEQAHVEDSARQAEIEADIDALRQAMGIPPPSSPAPAASPRLGGAAADVRPPALTRSLSSDTRASIATTSTAGQASMKRLLTTLRDVSDSLDKVQKVAWDAFITKRQATIASTKPGGGQDETKDEVKKRRKKHGGVRTRSVTNGPLNVFTVDADEDGDGKSRVEESENSWTDDLVGVSQMGFSGKAGKEDWQEFKELVKKGIPIAYRPKIWAECSGANEAREPGVYQDLLERHRGQDNPCLNQIDMDCHRTFPTNVFFAGNGPGVAKLRNVLVAYSWRNPQIGYCQGMNNLTATLLLTHSSEEDAFWVLVCIIEKILPSDYYTSHLLVSQADQRVLNDFVRRLLPDVADHLEELGVELPAITFGWFLSLFTDALPIQTLLRVWDLIFVMGTVVLFRVTVAIFQMNKDDILACDSAASLYALMRAVTGHLYQVDKLVRYATEDLRIAIKDREVSALRSKHVADLQAELGIQPEEVRAT
ncbi:hypothetical protein ACM66B_001768 [Microbotryomycetes sp. NB124-2]